MPELKLSYEGLNSHIGIFADTGAGKGMLLERYLQNVERAGEVAVVWDPDREAGRSGWIFDPSAEECPYWLISEEVEDEADASEVTHA